MSLANNLGVSGNVISAYWFPLTETSETWSVPNSDIYSEFTLYLTILLTKDIFIAFNFILPCSPNLESGPGFCHLNWTPASQGSLFCSVLSSSVEQRGMGVPSICWLGTGVGATKGHTSLQLIPSKHYLPGIVLNAYIYSHRV